MAIATRILALLAAIGILVLFAFSAIRSYNHPSQPVPGEMYPLAGLAASFLFGWGVRKNSNK